MKQMKLTHFVTLTLLGALVSCGGGMGSGSTSGLGSGSGSGAGGNGSSGPISWVQVSNPPGASAIQFLDFGSNGHWFVADNAGGFYRSTDQGSTWTQINSGIATNYGFSINVDPANGNLIASIYSSGALNAHPVTFYQSSNEGASWTAISSGQLSSSAALTGCAFASNGDIVCGGFWAPFPSSGAWFSTNGGQSFTAATTTSTNGDTVYSLALNPVTNDLWMGTEQNGIFRSTDNGATWTAESPADTNVDPTHGIRDGNIYAITFNRNGDVIFGSQGGIWKSSSNGSGGFTWTNVKNNSNTGESQGLARDANGTLYYGHRYDTTDPTPVYCSTDAGSTWQACDSGMPQYLQAHHFALNPSDRKMYAVTRQESTGQTAIYRTVNPVQ